MSERAWKTQQNPHFLYMPREDFLCGEYVTHEIICTVLRLSIFFESVVMYSEVIISYFDISGKNCNPIQDLLDIRLLAWPSNCYNTTLGCFLSHSGGHT